MRCTKTIRVSFLTKQAILKLHTLAKCWLNDTVKHKGFNNDCIEISKNVRCRHPIFDRHMILSFMVHLVFNVKGKHLAVVFIKALKIIQFKEEIDQRAHGDVPLQILCE